MKAPVISVITVVYNGESVLEATILSVLNQTYPHIEYILVDGASKDGTLAIIKKYEDRVKYISEKDKGLYDAMNKGLQMATGDFVWFLNAADYFYGPETVALVAALASDDVDVLYGDTMLENELREEIGLRSEKTVHRLPNVLTKSSFRFGMNVCHQAFVARRSIAPAYDFERFRLTADIDWCIKVLERSQRNVHVHATLARFLVGGLSAQRNRESLKERFAVLRAHYGLFPTLFAHVWIVVRAGWFKVRG
jgi:glycosyltransferase involved in cell wall biosynthesis